MVKGATTRRPRIARATLETAEHAMDHRGKGEALYALMRILRRLHKYQEVTGHRHEAIEAFAAAPKPGHDDKATLPWRVGLVYLVAGFTEWRAGNLPSAMGLLHTADCLLQQSEDFIARANVHHTFGVILRSQGRADAALQQLNRARGLYATAGHDLNLARVHTDIGRVHLDSRDWKLAHEEFELAEGISTSGHYSRAQEEVSLWKSWLAQDPDSPYYDLDEASRLAELAANAPALMVQVEGHVANGYALAKLGLLDDADSALKAALTTASATDMAKHLANVWLSLADIHSQYSPTRLAYASDCCEEAQKQLTKDSSAFLLNKLEAVRKQVAGKILENKDKSLFIRSIDQVFAEGLPESRRRLFAFAIESALRNTTGDIKMAARLLGLSPDYLRKKVPANHSRRPAKPVEQKTAHRVFASRRSRKNFRER